MTFLVRFTWLRQKTVSLLSLWVLCLPLSWADNPLSLSLSGIYTGEYNMTLRAAPTGAILGSGVNQVKWQWNFDEGTATLAGTTLTVGFNYAIHDLDDADANTEILYFDDNGDDTYTLHYSLQIYHPGLGYPMANTSTTFKITESNGVLSFITLDRELTQEDGIAGTQIEGVFPLTIEPDMVGTAFKLDSDINGDGLSDELARVWGLDPQSYDTDDDGLSDVLEIGENPSHPLDQDGDSMIDALEFGDHANNANIISGLALISGSSAQLNIAAPWLFTAASNNSMQQQIDPVQSVEDIVTKDSTLGDPGIDYPSGNIQFSAKVNAEQDLENQIIVIVRFSHPLPSLPLLYGVNASTGEYDLINKRQWAIESGNRLQVTFQNNSVFDLDKSNEVLTVNLAVGDNNIGGLQRKDQQGGAGGLNIYLLLFLIMLAALPSANDRARELK